MTILILEDESLAARDLTHLLSTIESGVQVAGILKSVAEANQWFDKHPTPDLILADIQLADGSSFELFESRLISCPVIFTTAYDAYAIRAFKLNSIDYLLKPIDADELRHAFRKYKSLTDSSAYGEQVKSLVHSLLQPVPTKKYRERFLAEVRNALVPVSTNDIACFTKDELIFLYTFGSERLICDCRTLDEVERLVDPARFYRANRQYIVNINAIDKIKTSYKGLTLVLHPPLQLEIEISKEKAPDFKKWMEVV